MDSFEVGSLKTRGKDSKENSAAMVRNNAG